MEFIDPSAHFETRVLGVSLWKDPSSPRSKDGNRIVPPTIRDSATLRNT
jgi:hypothetical protein